MPDFNVRSDSVNVEQIMEQIRARIREKRCVDYTEQQIQELAAVRLEKFLDPRGVRSDLLNEFRRGEPDPNYEFEEDTLFRSTRAPLRWIRQLLKPILKLFFNPNPLIHTLHIQSRLNDLHASRHQLYYELIHNLVVETTRLGIEAKNLSMRVESLDARVDFSERRARALEGAVMYQPQVEERDEMMRAVQPVPLDHGLPRPTSAPSPTEGGSEAASGSVAQSAGLVGESAGQRSRRWRRRRRRRGGAAATTVMGSLAQSPSAPEPSASDATHNAAPPSEEADAGPKDDAQ